MSAVPILVFENIFDLSKFKVRSGYDNIDGALAHLEKHCQRLNLAKPLPAGSTVWISGRMLRPFRQGSGPLEFLLEDDQSLNHYIRCIDASRQLRGIYHHIYRNPYFETREPGVGVCGTLFYNGENGNAILSQRPPTELLLDLAVISPVEQEETNQVLYLYYPGDYLTKLLQR